MTNHIKFNDDKFLYYDSDTMPYKKYNPFSHFALTDALITYAGKKNQAIIHFWQTKPLAILGMMDTKVGNFQDAIQIFEKHNHNYILRNSGGLGIISDSGILNISLIYPTKEHRLSIDEGYELMLSFIRETFYPHFPGEIEAYEISNSYCFGDYDLSINGRKIAGIAQRRIQDGVAVMIYISINGDQNHRAEMMKKFYAIGLDGSEPENRFPAVDPKVMMTLEDAYETTLSVDKVKQMMLKQFTWEKGLYTAEIARDFKEGLEKMKRRNARFFGEEFVFESLKER